MLKILIKSNEYNQVLIIKNLVSNPSASITNLTQLLNIQKVTLLRYIKNLNNDFNSLFPQNSIELVTDSDNIILYNNNSIPIYTIIHKLMTNYLLNSISYQVIKSLLLKNSQNTAHLVESINISQSYFNKLIKQINTYIAPTSIKIVQRNKEIFFYGSELNIIYLEYLMRYFIERFETVPLIKDLQFPDLISLANDHTLSDLNDIQLKRVTTLYHSFQKRKNYFTSLTIENNDIRDILKVIVDTHDFIVDPKAVNILNYSEDAPLLANFLTRIISTGLDTTTTHVEISKKLLNLNNPIVTDAERIVIDFCYTFIPHIKKKSPLYMEFIYIVTINIIYVRLFGFDFKNLFRIGQDTMPISQSFYTKNYHSIENYFIDETNFKSVTFPNQYAINNNRQLFIDTCYLTLKSSKKNKLAISFDFIYNLSFEHYLQERLHTIFNSEMLIYVEESINSDILITDHIVPIKGKTLLFTFNDINSSYELENLLQLTTSLYNKKIS